MAEITASLVKELRERTGAGMMECKKALVEANGDIELAIDNMRKSGQAKAAKKAGRVAAEGVILARVENGFGVLVEMNCETDFVAKDAGFLGLANEVADFAAANKGTTIEALQAQFEEKRAALVAKIGENMNIRRVAYLDGQVIAQYLHGAENGYFMDEWKPLWVVDFPMFEYDEDGDRYVAVHHPFTAPKEGFFLYVGTVDTDGTAADFPAVQHHIVGACQAVCRVGNHQVFVTFFTGKSLCRTENQP